MVRVRIAPAPTGFLHIGTARTALFNYLFAKKYKGSFIVRIEDTDPERSRKEYEKEILESLLWLGLKWDEGVAYTQNQKLKIKKYLGDYGPYRQSERIPIYEKYLKKLLDENKAYYCFCSEEELEIQKQDQISQGKPPRYSGKCATLSKREVKKLKKEGKPSVIRFRTPSKKIIFNDLIRGKIEFDSQLFDDFVVAKDLKTPLYNFACTIDDFEMKISHVIRGEDHISNTPKQILLQKALNFPQPKYAHISLTLGPDKSKLSKRHGATSITEYRKQGYLPESLINFMALLGWNPDTDREIFSLTNLIKEFSLEKMQKNPAIFNIEKLNWLNGYYIRKKSLEELIQLCLPYLVKAGLITPLNKSLISFKIKETGEIITKEKLSNIVRLEQERMKKLSEIGERSDFFFKDKLDYNKELLRWKNMTDEELKQSLIILEKIISGIQEKDFKKEIINQKLKEEADRGVGQDKGKLFWPLRVALSGKEASPGPCEIAEVLGKKKTLKRIKEAKAKNF